MMIPGKFAIKIVTIVRAHHKIHFRETNAILFCYHDLAFNSSIVRREWIKCGLQTDESKFAAFAGGPTEDWGEQHPSH